MGKVSQPPDDSRAPYSPVSNLATSSTSTSLYDSRPQFVSVFDDDFGQRQVEANASMPTPPSAPISTSDTYVTVIQGRTIGRIEKLRQQLATMLPCQEDVDCLMDSSHGWWLIRRHMLPHLLRIPESDLRARFNVSAVSASSPMIIARLLLCVALCIQQLPPNANLPRLRTKMPLRELMENTIGFVSRTVISDDELTGSIEGVECFTLQGLYQIFAGNFRRGWLAYRKAINVAQLMGLHRVSLKTSQKDPDLMEARRHYMWFQIMQEVYTSLNDRLIPH
jgi:hypothetical protein